MIYNINACFLEFLQHTLDLKAHINAYVYVDLSFDISLRSAKDKSFFVTSISFYVCSN